MGNILHHNGQQWVECSPGEELKVGYLLKKDGFGISFFTIERTTKTTAFIKWNEIATGKFPRVYSGYFRPKGERGFLTVRYSAFKPASNETSKTN